MGLCNSSEATKEPNQDAPQKKPIESDKVAAQQQQKSPTAPSAAASTEQKASTNEPAVEVQPASSRSAANRFVSVQPSPPPAAPSSPVSAPPSLSDDEYRSQIKSIFLFIVDRLMQTMEYERESMHQLAQIKQSLSPGAVTPDSASYLTLFASPQIEKFIRTVCDLSHQALPSPLSAAQVNDRSVKEQNFLILVKGAQQEDASRSPVVSRTDLTRSVKEVCSLIQSELLASQKLLRNHKDVFGNRFKDLDTHFEFFVKCLEFTRGDIDKDAALLERNVEEIIQASS